MKAEPCQRQTEPGSPAAACLEAARQRFIELWGQMASTWGVPRSMAEAHALLFIEGRPMNADEVMSRLGISRGNASMTLRTLVDWGIVARSHHAEDRRDYFAAEQDVWTLLATVVRARKRREIAPLEALLQDCRKLTADGAATSCEQAHLRAEIAQVNAKLDALLQMVRAIDAMSEEFLAAASMGALRASPEARA